MGVFKHAKIARWSHCNADRLKTLKTNYILIRFLCVTVYRMTKYVGKILLWNFKQLLRKLQQNHRGYFFDAPRILIALVIVSPDRRRFHQQNCQQKIVCGEDTWVSTSFESMEPWWLWRLLTMTWPDQKVIVQCVWRPTLLAIEQTVSFIMSIILNPWPHNVVRACVCMGSVSTADTRQIEVCKNCVCVWVHSAHSSSSNMKHRHLHTRDSNLTTSTALHNTVKRLSGTRRLI